MEFDRSPHSSSPHASKIPHLPSAERLAEFSDGLLLPKQIWSVMREAAIAASDSTFNEAIAAGFDAGYQFYTHVSDNATEMGRGFALDFAFDRQKLAALVLDFANLQEKH